MKYSGIIAYQKALAKAIEKTVAENDLNIFKKFMKKYHLNEALEASEKGLPSDEVLKVSIAKMACNSNFVNQKTRDYCKELLISHGFKTTIG